MTWTPDEVREVFKKTGQVEDGVYIGGGDFWEGCGEDIARDLLARIEELESQLGAKEEELDWERTRGLSVAEKLIGAQSRENVRTEKIGALMKVITILSRVDRRTALQSPITSLSFNDVLIIWGALIEAGALDD